MSWTLTTAPGWGEILLPEKAPFDPKTARISVPSRLPSRLWNSWLALAFALAKDGGGERREVGVLLLRSADPPHERWRIMVPAQTVGGASLTYDLSRLADIVTGEESEGIPDGWLHVGSSHSHNDMAAFFSGTDDRDELGVPGAHVVIGRIDHERMTYRNESSIVHLGRRYGADIDALVDTTPDGASFKFHPHVRTLIEERAPVRLALPAAKPRFECADSMSDALDWFADVWGRSVTEEDPDAPDPDAYYTLMDLIETLDAEGVDDARRLIEMRAQDLARGAL